MYVILINRELLTTMLLIFATVNAAFPVLHNYVVYLREPGSPLQRVLERVWWPEALSGSSRMDKSENYCKFDWNQAMKPPNDAWEELFPCEEATFTDHWAQVAALRAKWNMKDAEFPPYVADSLKFREYYSARKK